MLNYMGEIWTSIYPLDFRRKEGGAFQIWMEVNVWSDPKLAKQYVVYVLGSAAV